MTDSYLPGTKDWLHELFVSRLTVRTGAMVLAHSLRDHGTQKLLAALVTLDSVSSSSIEELKVHSS